LPIISSTHVSVGFPFTVDDLNEDKEPFFVEFAFCDYINFTQLVRIQHRSERV